MTKKYRADKIREDLVGEIHKELVNHWKSDVRQVTLFDDDSAVVREALFDDDSAVVREVSVKHIIPFEYLIKVFSSPHDGHQLLSPPRPAKFMLLLIPLRQREHLLGDLEEEFRTTLVPEYGLRWARIYYYWHVWIEIASAVARGLKGAVIGYLISKFTK